MEMKTKYPNLPQECKGNNKLNNLLYNLLLSTSHICNKFVIFDISYWNEQQLELQELQN